MTGMSERARTQLTLGLTAFSGFLSAPLSVRERALVEALAETMYWYGRNDQAIEALKIAGENTKAASK